MKNVHTVNEFTLSSSVLEYMKKYYYMYLVLISLVYLILNINYKGMEKDVFI